MEDYVKQLFSSNGDIVHITLSENTILFSEETIQLIGDVKLVGVDLRRLAGKSSVSQNMLAAIEKVIADFYMVRNNTMIFYYCDFINPIPNSQKTDIPPQEYRSNLFKLMFDRYVSQHNINNIHLSIITAKGIDETFYFHLIYKDEQAPLVPIISQDIKEGYEK